MLASYFNSLCKPKLRFIKAYSNPVMRESWPADQIDSENQKVTAYKVKAVTFICWVSLLCCGKKWKP